MELITHARLKQVKSKGNAVVVSFNWSKTQIIHSVGLEDLDLGQKRRGTTS